MTSVISLTFDLALVGDFIYTHTHPIAYLTSIKPQKGKYNDEQPNTEFHLAFFNEQ